MTVAGPPASQASAFPQSAKAFSAGRLAPLFFFLILPRFVKSAAAYAFCCLLLMIVTQKPLFSLKALLSIQNAWLCIALSCNCCVPKTSGWLKKGFCVAIFEGKAGRRHEMERRR
jgi:hypothetical protein